MAACADGSCAVQNLSRDEKRQAFEHDPANVQHVWLSLSDDLIRIGHQYFDCTAGIGDTEESLHDVWDELIHAAKAIPSASPEHDRLVTLVLQVRELGHIVRKKTDAASEHDQEAAIMPNGQRLWTDLPYLVQELQNSWTRESSAFAVAERESLAVLTAKLCATGICAADLACCALWLFREALETERPLAAGSSASEESHPTVAHLLPACHEWLKYGNFKLAKLCMDNYRPALSSESGHDGQMSTAPGPLAAMANVTQDGFCMARWLFWRRRFGELYLSGLEPIAEPARKCFEVMVGTGTGAGLNIPGEKRYLEKLFQALDKELAARDYQECVGPEDIEIDPSWVNES